MRRTYSSPIGSIEALAVFGALLAALASPGCSSPDESEAFTVVGTMKFEAGVEGGCWVFQADSGHEYELVGEKVDQIRVDGRRYELKVKPRPDFASICMIAPIVEVLEVMRTL